MAARGGGRRDCWSRTVSMVLFLNMAEMRLLTQLGPGLLYLKEKFKD